MAINLLSARLSTYLSSERAAIEACEEEKEAEEGKQREAIKAAIKLSALLPPSYFLPFLPSFVLHAYNHRCREERAGRRRRATRLPARAGFLGYLISPLSWTWMGHSLLNLGEVA